MLADEPLLYSGLLLRVLLSQTAKMLSMLEKNTLNAPISFIGCKRRRLGLQLCRRSDEERSHATAVKDNHGDTHMTNIGGFRRDLQKAIYAGRRHRCGIVKDSTNHHGATIAEAMRQARAFLVRQSSVDTQAKSRSMTNPHRRAVDALAWNEQTVLQDGVQVLGSSAMKGWTQGTSHGTAAAANVQKTAPHFAREPRWREMETLVVATLQAPANSATMTHQEFSLQSREGLVRLQWGDIDYATMSRC